jgi:hypothetical protein
MLILVDDEAGEALLKHLDHQNIPPMSRSLVIRL